MDTKKLVQQMTLEEKASLCSGHDFWHFKGIERFGIPSVMVTDGPHGLRKQETETDHLGIGESAKSTCFPAACTTSASFDESLLEELGKAIADEALQEDVAVVLGPAMNIKRSPLCGRNFEYISEDPFVTGRLATALARGIEGKGVGTSAKHFAANNQEYYRMTNNSVVDERAFREIYLSAFEHLVKKEQPATLMCSYNRINGVFASESKELLNDILRDEWGFEGIIVTDWGATNDRVEGLKAGQDVEMPATRGRTDKEIVDAVKAGTLDIAVLDKTAERITRIIMRAKETADKNKNFKFDAAKHNDIARRAAEQSMVLLKNDSILPIAKETKVAVIGEFAKKPRFQGAGSSLINSLRLDNICEAFEEAGVAFDYADGYSLEPGSGVKAEKIKEACDIAKDKEVVFVFAGLPAEYESEGFDRTNMDMPQSHNQLIEAVSKVNPNVVVVLQCGAPVAMPWADNVKAILLAYLGGQAGGKAVANVVLGKVSPSGKLAETFPKALEDTACHNYYPGTPVSVEYRESIFVGYRYYDAVNKQVAYPFGYGMSYTKFDYSDLKLSSKTFKKGDTLSVSFKIKNIGKVAGAESAQVYVGRHQASVFRAPKELKGFAKVSLQPGEEKEVVVELDDRSFAYYNVPAKDWAIEGGDYSIMVGESSQSILLTQDIKIEGDGREELVANLAKDAPVYYNLPSGALTISDANFTTVYGKAIPPSVKKPGGPYDMNTTASEIRDTFIGKQIYGGAKKREKELFGDNEEMIKALRPMLESSINYSPMRTLKMMMPAKKVDGMVDMLNGKKVKGFLALIFGK